MKYLNTYNNVYYWIENGVVYYGTSDIKFESHFTTNDIAEMVESGEMVEVIDATPNEFKAAVEAIAQNGINPRFAAWCVDTGNHHTAIGMQRGASYMSWISDRKMQYADKYPEKLSPALGSGVILDQEHFTSFIVSGEWM